MGFATATQDIVVPDYDFSGFLTPVDNAPVVKFGQGRGYDIFDAGTPSVARVDCDTGAVLDEIEESYTAGASTLQYDLDSDAYTYVWKTREAWAGTCCRLTLHLIDASQPYADFSFRWIDLCRWG